MSRPKEPDKEKTSFNLTSRARDILAELSTEMGITKTSVVEIALREMFNKKMRELYLGSHDKEPVSQDQN